MSDEVITQLANILYNKVMEWVKVTPEEDRQDADAKEEKKKADFCPLFLISFTSQGLFYQSEPVHHL